MRQFVRLFKEQEGLETVEYAVVAGILTAGAVATIALIATWVSTRFSNLNSALGTA